jgi:DNA polymerase-3 subunit beta
MKFIISSNVLLKNLQAIQGVINTNNTLPILDDFLFDLNEDVLTITSSDLETTMRLTVKPDKSEETGSIAIPAKILVDTLKTFPEIPVSFNINIESLMVEISAGEGKYKLSGHKAEEYPRTPSLEDTTAIKLDSYMMAQAINKTIFATGNDELRLVLSGIFCELSPEDVTFVTTDAHKLVRYKRTDLKSTHSASFILPK